MELPPTAGFPSEVDVEAQFNIRQWVQDALVAKGAKITGAGVGVEGSDLDFEVEGFPFNVWIKHLPLKPTI